MCAIVFDGYGTLFDAGKENIPQIAFYIGKVYGVSGELVYEIWSREYFKLESQFKTHFMTIVDANRLSLKTAFRELHLPTKEVERWIFQLINFWSNGKMFEGANNLLHLLKSRYKDIRIGLLSNTDNLTISKEISNTGISLDFVVTSESAKSYKPERYIFDYMMQKYNIDPIRSIYIGNSHRDIIGASSIGMYSIFFNHENLTPIDCPTLLATVDSLSEVQPVIDKFLTDIQ
ncbi:MAG: HAD family hydrolase [Prevotellaceae bacterium]|jgi:HAD superfamily hydrolase (TIGR01549 family)|nr:HAD family hydrolase [Prevotellaceae bacterium]